MPIASSSSTSGRLLALLSLLQASRHWPAVVLAERLEVSERTVRRDAERLRELGYAIEATRGRHGGYRLGTGAHLPPLMLDDEQAVALAIALRGAGALGAGIEEAAERALHTVLRTMPERLARRVDGVVLAGRTSGDEADPAVLLRIGEAIRAGQELRFDYASPTRETDPTTPPPVRRTEPHHLLLHGGRWYLLGYDADRDDWRVHRVDRIAPRSHTGRRFTPRQVPGGDPARFLSARFKGSSGKDAWPCRGEAVLHAPLGAVAPYVGDGTAEAIDEERCRVRLGSWSWAGLAANLARFDAPFDVVGPPELVRACAQLALRFAAAAGA